MFYIVVFQLLRCTADISRITFNTFNLIKKIAAVPENGYDEQIYQKIYCGFIVD